MNREQKTMRAENNELRTESNKLKTRIDVMREEMTREINSYEFCFSNFEACDKDVQFYTGLPSAGVFYHLLDFVSPNRQGVI